MASLMSAAASSGVGMGAVSALQSAGTVFATATGGSTLAAGATAIAGTALGTAAAIVIPVAGVGAAVGYFLL